MRRAFATFLSVLLIGCFLPSAQAQKRLALVVGNAGYMAISPLAGPVNDATLEPMERIEAVTANAPHSPTRRARNTNCGGVGFKTAILALART